MASSRQTIWRLPLFLVGLMLLSMCCSAYQLVISDKDEVRQVCSGMYGGSVGKPAFINVIFGPSSKGQLALVIYEWGDAAHLGVDQTTPDSEDAEAWSSERVYICTLSALDAKLCTEDELGRFITTPPSLASSASNSSIFTTSVRFDPVYSADDQYGQNQFRYDVTRTGYYCVGSVPVALEQSTSNSSYIGVVDFENAFGGDLSASEYPKVNFYFILSMIYLGCAAVWITLCWKHRRELLPIQNYITATIIFLVFEMLAVWRYYAYVNDKGHPGVSAAFLVLVTVLNAFRNSVSFFLLLVVSMGYSIVRPTLGGDMLRVRVLTIVHFAFGVLYSLGTSSFPLDAPGAALRTFDIFLVFFCVLPLSFSLTAFLMWIMWSLNSTINDLGNRRQSYKTAMFVKLYRILAFSVIVIFVFFVISSLSFSYRLDDDFAPDTWRFQWVLLDGWLSVLYMVVFFSIAWIWRPTDRNRRLALSEELPTDELDADQYDVDAMATGDGDDDDDGEGGERVALKKVRNDTVVFDVGSDDDEEEAIGGRSHKKTGEHAPLRFEDSDEEGDITRHHERSSSTVGDVAPPRYSDRD